MFLGPVFAREATIAPRRPRLYLLRTVYAVSLFVLMCTAWLILAGTQIINNIGDMAKFGSTLFFILALIQLALVLFLSALQAASAVAQEKDKKTLILLLMTRMSNSELVLGKLVASQLTVVVMLVTALPIFFLITLFGGVSFEQIFGVFAVTALSAVAAGSLGSILALWREKTFQALAGTALILVFWFGAWEGIGLLDGEIFGISTSALAGACSPYQATIAAASPNNVTGWMSQVAPYLIVMCSITFLLNTIAILRVRVWNPSRDVMPGQTAVAQPESIWGIEHDLNQEKMEEVSPLTPDQVAEGRYRAAERLREGHIDSRRQSTSSDSRKVWDNPILWREMRTWAYGKKVIFVRLAYWLLFTFVAISLHLAISSGEAVGVQDEVGTNIPVASKPLAPFFLVSLFLVNALAVTSITNERDGRSLDLLLVTDLSPKEFLAGKLFGILYVTRDMVVLPLVLVAYLWFNRGITTENLLYVVVGLVVLNLFVAMLGIHCGMNYANSRRAISVSMGTVFFLFLGMVTCMVMMVSFSSSFQGQLTPFLAFIVGGGIGLFASLGHRNPSPAIALASGVLPLAMFFAITSLLLGKYFSVFIVMAMTYGFATTALVMPALGEFSFATGRMKTVEDE